MSDSYTEYKFTITPLNPGSEVLMAELAEMGFESFEETDYGLLAYISTQLNCPDLLEEAYVLHSNEFKIDYTVQVIEQVNWNEKWEKGFQPIIIADTCQIRASFHPEKNFDYDIIINPKMAFGTGHHATTHLMTEFLLQEDVIGKTVLDMGCGTGILAILSSKKGAKTIDAIDIDEWSYRNAIENIELNYCDNITVFEGDTDLLKDKTNKYDIVFANINRNILVQDMAVYSNCLIDQGRLFLSGFYKKDLPVIKAACEKNQLTLEAQKTRDNWVSVKCRKEQV